MPKKEQNKIAENEKNPEKIFLGTYLRHKREERGIELKSISQKTKINLSLLEALEGNQFEKLPNKAYVMGFVKSYTKMIGIENNEAIRLLDMNYGKNRGVDGEDLVLQQHSSMESFKSKFPLLTLMLAIFLLILVVKMASNKNAQSEPKAKSSSVAKDMKLVEKSTTPQPEAEVITSEIEEQPELTLTPTPTPLPVAPEKEVVKQEQAPEQEEKKKVENEDENIKFYPIPKKLYSFAKKQDLSDLPDSFKAQMTEGKQNVLIKAVDGDTWITYKNDDRQPVKFILEQGKVLFIQGDFIRIFLGNVHATKIFLNNQLLKITSKSGVKSLIFPQEDSKGLKLPLFIFQDNGKVIPSDEYQQQ
jgi:cytoskeleton protein RodZ